MGELKPGWRRVRLGEVVRLGKERCDPAADGIERYIGLEHIEPGDLRVRSWGDVSDGTTFTTRVRPGHVLFGKRRAYQRKVAVADFDAVCSGDIYVFESANPAKLLPELLPFLCQTDEFFDHAVGTSAGSLSPRTNWTSLAEYEFALPPLEEQRKACAALAAAMGVSEWLRTSVDAAKVLLTSATLDSFAGVHERVPLQSYCRAPITYGIVQAGPDLPSGVPYVRVSEMTGRDYLSPASMMKTSPEISATYARTILELNDVVVALRGVPGHCHIVGSSMVGCNLSRGVARVAHSAGANPRYLLWALRSPQVNAAVFQYANGWKGEDLREITIGQLRTLPIPRMTREGQDSVVGTLESLHQAWLCSRARQRAFDEGLVAALRSRLLTGVS